MHDLCVLTIVQLKERKHLLQVVGLMYKMQISQLQWLNKLLIL